MKYDVACVTGCDDNCEWQLPWFLENYFSNTNIPLIFMDFGITAEAADLLCDYNVEIITFNSNAKGWFKKPRAIYEATNVADVVCWLDTDCQLVGDIEDIFSYYVPNKIGMVEDRPWTKRRPDNGAWHNSGVVLTDRNDRLVQWLTQCETTPAEGDQEILHYMYSPIQRLSIIEQLPHKFNSLRLDYIDNIQVIDPIVIHHTGAKGNDEIRRMMK